MKRLMLIVLAAVLITPALPARAGDVGFSLRIGNTWHSGKRHHSGKYHRRGHHRPHSRTHYGFNFRYDWPGYRHSNFRSSYIYRPYIPRTVVYNTTCPPTTTTSYIITNPQPRETVVHVPTPTARSRVVYGSASDRVYEPETRVYTPQPVERRSVTVTGQSWPLLREGRFDNALEQFAAEAQLSPDDGLPKLGYALAAAGRGDLDRAVWAMRRAMRVEPEAMHRVSINDAMREQLRGMIDSYVLPLPGDDVSDKDSAFMVACLHLILGEAQPAADAIDRAVTAGDDSEEAQQIRGLIDAARRGE